MEKMLTLSKMIIIIIIFLYLIHINNQFNHLDNKKIYNLLKCQN